MAITAIASDTGSSSSDFITNDTTLTVSGTNGALAAGEKIQVSSDGGTTWTDVVQNGTTWSLVDATSHPSSFTYQARIVDTAGNIGTTASHAVTIDTTAPAEALAITAIASDTGSSSSDFITSDTTLTVSGTNGALSAGEKIQVSSDGGTTWTDVIQNTATSWSLVDPDHASVELYLSGADRRHRRQYRHYREPGYHHRHHGPRRSLGDHGDCHRHRQLILRLHYQ